MNSNLYTAALLLVAVSAPGALAEAPADGAPKAGEGPRPALQRLLNNGDTNGDKKLDLAEIHSKLPNFPAERFQGLDKNGDGFLEASEIPQPKADGRAAAGGARGEARERLRKADSDGDGKVSETEFTAAFPSGTLDRFKAMDKNQDGFVEAGELPQPKAEADGPAGGAARGELMEKMRTADTDGDRKVSREEFTAAFPDAPEERFGALDRNGDGYVDRSDRQDGAAGGAAKGKDKDGAAAKKVDNAAYVSDLVSRHDADKDGKLTLAEIQSAKPGFPEKSFAALDRDKDGALTSADTPAKQ